MALRCQYCGARCDLTFDHVRPKAQGGRTAWGNMVYACQKCNEKKGARTPKQAGMTLRGKPIRKKDTMPKKKRSTTTRRRRTTTGRKTTTRRKSTRRTTGVKLTKTDRKALHSIKTAVEKVLRRGSK